MAGGAPSEWRLHLGVHKTATTHLQQTLSARRSDLAACGVDVAPMELIRSRRIPDIRLRNWRALLGGRFLRAELLRKLAPHIAGSRPIVMSEEDWLGGSQDALAPRIYPKTRRRLGALVSAMRDEPVTLFLSLRSLDEVLPAAYATALRFQPMPGGFEPVRRRTLESPPSWVDLVERIRRAAPRATLRVWRYEDYRANSLRIASEVCGVALEPKPDLPDPPSTRTPGAEAVAAVERLPDTLPQDERRGRVEEIFAASLVSQERKFSPFSDVEARRLRIEHEDQMREIFARFPEAELRFG